MSLPHLRGLACSLPLALVITSTAEAQTPSIRLAPAEVTGGTPTAVVINLNAPAPAGGVPVSLSLPQQPFVSFASGLFASVTVPQGSGSLSVPLRTRGVAAPTAIFVRAKHATRFDSLQLRLRPPQVKAITLRNTGLAGGEPLQAEITLDGSVADGTTLTVTLAVVSSLSTLRERVPTVEVPDRVDIPAGGNRASVAITTQPVASQTARTVTARVGDGPAASVIVNVRPPKVVALRFSTSSHVGGQPVGGSVELDGMAPLGGMTLQYGVLSGSGVRAPENGTIAAGSRKASFSAPTVAVKAPVTDGLQVLARTVGDGANVAEGRLIIVPPGE